MTLSHRMNAEMARHLKCTEKKLKIKYSLFGFRFAIARRGGVDDASAFRLRKRGHSTLNSPVESEQLPSVKEVSLSTFIKQKNP